MMFDNNFKSKFFNLSNEVLCVLNADLIILEANEAWRSVLGWNIKEVISKRITDFVHEEDQEVIQYVLNEELESELTTFILKIKKSSGEYNKTVWSVSKAQKSFDVVYICSSVNIGQYGVDKDLLSNKDDLSKLLLENIPTVISIKNLRGEYLYVNKHFLSVFNLETNEVIGKRDKDFFDIDYQEQVGIAEEQVKSSLSKFQSEESIFINEENRYFSSIRFPLFNKLNQIISICCISNDVTKNKRIERMLIQQNFALDQSAIVEVTDINGMITYVNDNFTTVTGYSREEVIGESYKIIASDHHGKEYFKNMWDTILSGRVWKDVVKNKKKNGEFYWVDTTIVPFTNAEGKIVQFIAIRYDVSQRVEIENLIWQQKDFQKAILDSSKYMIIAADLNGKIVSVNKSAEQMLEYASSELLEKKSPLVFHDKDELMLRRKELGKLIDSSNLQINTVFNHNLEHVPVEQGTPDHYGQLEDQDDIQKQEDKKQEDNDEKQNSYSASIFRKERDLFRTLVYKAEKYDVIDESEWTYVSKSGKRIPMMLSISCVKNNVGETTGYLFTGYDMTERKAIESKLVEAKNAETQANRAKSEFLSNMSHEIRTPLNAIIGAVDLLLDTKLSSEQKSYVELFKRAGQSLLYITNDILDLSKIEAGKMNIDSRPFRLSEVVSDIKDQFAFIAQKSGIGFEVDVESELLKSYKGDAVRLKQILSNLISNAIKFTKKGRVQFIVKTNTESGKNGNIHFRVVDSGIGIPKDKIKILFQNFVQADTGISRKFGGTGLGLAICKKLVELMRGDIWVTSEHGKGSCFEFTLPFEMLANDAVLTPINIKKSEILQFVKPKRILLVDDAIDNRLLIKAFLKPYNIIIDEAENGKVAFEKATQNQYDLILMDMQMPELDGFSATSMIRHWEKKNKREQIPIFALTAYALKEEEERSMTVGCNLHIAKPINKNLFINSISQYLEKKDIKSAS